MDEGGNRRLIEEHFDAKVRRDEATLRSQLTEDVRWWAPQSAEARGLLPRPVEGRDNVLALLMTLGLYVPEGRIWTIHHLIVDGDMVAAHATMQTQTVNGQPYRNDYVFIYEIRDGLISQAWEHLDTAYLYGQLDASSED